MKTLKLFLAVVLVIISTTLIAQQKVVLITGSASGIGKATAEHLIKEGHIVYGGDIQYEKNKYLDTIGGHSLDMDVTNDEQVKAGVAKVLKEQGRVDVLLNNAGYGLYGPVEEVSIEDAMHQFDVNLMGYARLAKVVLPVMRKQNKGLIINISSMGGKMYTPLGAWYHATKHAIEGWSDCLRMEVSQFGINVVIIEPGSIKTDFNSAVNTSDNMQNKDGSPYNWMREGARKSLDGEVKSSDPDVIAKVVSKAMSKKKPKTRYVKGALAKPLLFMRKIKSDRGFDKLMLKYL